MGQKVNPVGFRLGVYRDWDARWFAPGKTYGKNAVEDILIIRKFLDERLERADIARVEIEKAGESLRIILHSGRPGTVIGKKGQGIEELRVELVKQLGKRAVEISVQEVRQPELNAMLVAKSIAQQLSRRASYKRVTKRAAMSAMKAGAKGISISCAGRLGGAEIAREHWTRLGSVPRQTLRSFVDYALAEAKTTYGIIGVKVWLCQGEYQNVRQDSRQI